MKKFILSLLLFAFTTPVMSQSEKWAYVTETTSGARLFIDITSFATTKSDDNIPMIGSFFRFISDSGPYPEFVYLIPVESCLKQHGPIYLREYKNGKWVTSSQKWWAQGGTKVYDIAGITLCELLDVKLKSYKKEKEFGL